MKNQMIKLSTYSIKNITGNMLNDDELLALTNVSNSEFNKKLEDTFVDKLKPVIGDVNSKMELKLKDIRDNMLS